MRKALPLNDFISIADSILPKGHVVRADGRQSNGEKQAPLIVVDGVVQEGQQVYRYRSDQIATVNVLEDSSTGKYGEKGRNGGRHCSNSSSLPKVIVVVFVFLKSHKWVQVISRGICFFCF